MEKLRLQMALHQIAPALPDPYEFADKIADSLRFIDENPAAQTNDLTLEMLDLWCINPQELDLLQDCFGQLAGQEITPQVISSLFIFTHIYLTYYRIEDFADFDNFADCYVKFQRMINHSRHFAGQSFRLFELENLDKILDDASEAKIK